MNGVIKKLTDRGFGFIAAEGQPKDLFFHGKSLIGAQFDDLREGDAVSFDVENGEKGPAAVNVKVGAAGAVPAAAPANDNADADEAAA
ncbi:MAG: cold shock domain-containing protein [Patescibacteria group bacterium]